MRTTTSLTILAIVLRAYAQSGSVTLSGTTETTESPTATGADYATSGTTYADESSILTITGSTDYATISDLSSIFATSNGTATSSSTGSGNGTTTSSPTQTLLVGSAKTTTSLNGTATTNGTASRTSSSAQPTNTVPCNGHPALCNRKFSNITHVGAHNSPFIRPGNVAANQMLDVETQLNDGIRMRMWKLVFTKRSCC